MKTPERPLLERLEEKLKRTQRVQISEYAETESVYHPGSSSGGDGREKVWEEPTGRMIPIFRDVPDFRARLDAVNELGGLYYRLKGHDIKVLLEKAYSDFTRGSKEMRTKAGEYLGYSKLKIFFHNLGYP